MQWIDKIDKILKNYNYTEKRTIGCAPTEASYHLLQYIIINNGDEKKRKNGN